MLHHLKAICRDIVAGFKDAWQIWRDEFRAGNAFVWLEAIGWFVIVTVGIAWLLLHV